MNRLIVIAAILATLGSAVVIGSRFEVVAEPAFQGKTIAGHLRDLSGGDYQQRSAAEAALAAIGEPAVPFLIRTLQDCPGPLESVLLRVGRHVPFLRIDPSTSPQLRQRSAEQLAAITPRDQRVIRALISAFTDKDRAVVEEAQRSIRRIGLPAVDELARALRNRNFRVRLHAAEVLADLGPPAGAAVEDLQTALRDRNEIVRGRAATALASVAGANSVKPLCAGLKDRSAIVRAAVSDALGSIGCPASLAVPELNVALKDSEPAVRTAAARALWRINGDAPKAVPVLAAALSSQTGWQAALALGEIGAPASAAVPALLEALKREKVPRPLRQTPVSALALGQIGIASVPALITTLDNPDARVRTSATLALGFVGPNAASAVPQIVPLLNDPNPEVRRAATLSLGAIDPARKELVPALVAMASDEDIFLSSLAASTLQRIDPEAALALNRE
jgi:HEAT repeat protein